MRTEKWKGTVNELKAQPSFLPECIDPLVEQMGREFARARRNGFKALYMAGGAIPGVLTSFTYRGDVQEQSREYYEVLLPHASLPFLQLSSSPNRALFPQGLTLKIWEKAEENGLIVIRYPPNSSDYTERAIMDQIICARSNVFISTCHHLHVREYEQSVLGAKGKGIALVPGLRSHRISHNSS